MRRAVFSVLMRRLKFQPATNIDVVSDLMKNIKVDEKSHLALLVTFERPESSSPVKYGVTVEADTSLTMNAGSTKKATLGQKFTTKTTDRVCDAIRSIATSMARFGWNAPSPGSTFDARLFLSLSGDNSGISDWGAKLSLEAVAGAGRLLFMSVLTLSII